jgi:uncharacterized glyoxalase superfamily protein PhnB
MPGKRLTRDEKAQKTVETLINKMFEIAGHDVRYKDVKGRTDAWYKDWTMTVEQNDQWKTWGIEYLRKNMKLNKKSAEIEMAWITLMWGLTFSDFK